MRTGLLSKIVVGAAAATLAWMWLFRRSESSDAIREIEDVLLGEDAEVEGDYVQHYVLEPGIIVENVSTDNFALDIEFMGRGDPVCNRRSVPTYEPGRVQRRRP